MMKKSKSFMLPYNTLSYSVAIFTFLFALCFLIVSFITIDKLPDTVPLHWSEQGGFDRWGDKSELYPLPIISMAISAIALPSSVLLIRKSYNGFAYFVNGVSIFSSLMMIFAFLLMITHVM